MKSLVLYEKFGPLRKVWPFTKSLVLSEKFDMKVSKVAN